MELQGLSPYPRSQAEAPTNCGAAASRARIHRGSLRIHSSNECTFFEKPRPCHGFISNTGLESQESARTPSHPPQTGLPTLTLAALECLHTDETNADHSNASVAQVTIILLSLSREPVRASRFSGPSSRHRLLGSHLFTSVHRCSYSTKLLDFSRINLPTFHVTSRATGAQVEGISAQFVPPRGLITACGLAHCPYLNFSHGDAPFVLPFNNLHK